MKKFIFVVLLVMGHSTYAEQSDFYSLCQKTFPGSLNSCVSVHKLLFASSPTEPMLPVSVGVFGVEKHSIDARIQYVAFNDPNFVSATAYCYFVFRGWIDFSKMGPDQFGLQASGFAILNEKLDPYQKWLLSRGTGKSCAERVKKESLLDVINLKASLGSKLALIGINPLASLLLSSGELNAGLSDMKLTIQHERVHAYQISCPSFLKWSRAQWLAMPSDKRASVVAKHPEYNWGQVEVAEREYAAFLLESDPVQLRTLTKLCR